MSNVQVTEINGMKIYNLTGGKSLYEMMKESHFSVKKLKKSEEYMNHIEILQDATFPVSCECIRVSKDGNFLFASGIYPPRLKIYDLNEMSLKCERGFDSQIRKIEIISDDYKKCAALCEDRTIELHAQYGKHFKIRIPKYGRDLKYDRISCDLFSCGTGNEIYRLNLHQGQFLQSFQSIATGINSLGINTPLELLGSACEGGIVELFDLREKTKCFSFDDLGADCTSISFSNDGMQMAVGNKVGVVSIYDIRNPKPLFNITHAYRQPIIKIIFDEHSSNIITVDKKIAKFSNNKTGKAFTNIEPKHDINDFEMYPNSGMFFFGNESEKIDIYFIPQMGPAPKWASFLDNITEELEEAKTYSLYEDYKFLTAKELEAINGKELIGTKMVKAYMHGYFIDWKLYKKLKALSEPFSYENYLEKNREEKLKKYFGERIIFNSSERGAKVNKKLLSTSVGQNAQKDERFAKMFSDKNYEIDFTSDKFKKKNNSALAVEQGEEQLEEEGPAEEEKKEDEKDNIVSKEILKLNEKLMSKKRKRIEKMHDHDDNDEDFGTRVKNNENSSDDEDEILSKIKQLEKMQAHNKAKKAKFEKEENLKKNKRILVASQNISKLKYHK